MLSRLLFRRDVLSWCLYDWANSAFVTSVTVVVLPVYFLALTGPGELRVDVGPWTHVTSGEALWSYVTGVYMLAAGVAAPFLGAIADQVRGKKRFLLACVLVGSLLTCSLASVESGQYLLCAGIYVVAAFLWTCGNLFYDALLPDICATEREMDAVSSAGYAIGYLGGGLLLAVNLVMIMKPALLGLADAGAATRAVFVSVGVWWLLFTLPLLRWVPERSLPPSARTPSGAIRSAVSELAGTLRRARQYRQLIRVLIAFIFYNTGIGTVMTVAAIYGKSQLDLPDETLIGCILMIQMIGFPATYGFIALARRLGNRNAILAGIGVYIVVVVFAFYIQTATGFWALGVMVGLAQGGTQALSRSLYASMIPPGHSAEFFGFFSIFNKVGAFAGPIVFGIVRDVTGSSRQAILFLLTFFVIGLAILASVDVHEGRTVAGNASA